MKEEQVNLYAIVNHFPEKLFKEFRNTKFLKTVKEGEIFDLDLKPIKRIRFIVTREAENPVLALFSDNQEKVLKSYDLIEKQTDMTEGISKYYYELKRLYGKEVANMYTDEDYIRDYGHKDFGKPYWFPGEKEAKILEMQGQIGIYNELYEEKSISTEVFQNKVKPLEQKLLEIQSQ